MRHSPRAYLKTWHACHFFGDFCFWQLNFLSMWPCMLTPFTDIPTCCMPLMHTMRLSWSGPCSLTGSCAHLEAHCCQLHALKERFQAFVLEFDVWKRRSL